MKSALLTALALGTTLTACGQPSASDLASAWDPDNNPAIITGAAQQVRWDALPLDGKIATKGWSDDYWPTYKGGLAYRWQSGSINYKVLDASQASAVDKASPAEKFDLIMRRLDFPTLQAERGRTNVLRTQEGTPEYDPAYKIESWEGLCAGWAPASVNFAEPKKPVKVPSPLGEVTFYPSDIKGLLTYYQQQDDNNSTTTSFVSLRCREDFAKLDEALNSGTIGHDEWQQARESTACADINAGSFHILLTNEIGLQKKSFIVDVTRDFQVWNQPVNAFKSVVEDDHTTGLWPDSWRDAAPGTVREITVRTKMAYTVETASSTSPVPVKENVATYRYILELNDRDEIIGGRWLSEDRPDFAWRQSVPEFVGYFSRLRRIYEQSAM